MNLEDKIKQLEEQLKSTSDNGALDMLDAIIPLNIIEDIEKDEKSDVRYILKLKRYEVKFHSIDELVKLAQSIADTLKDKQLPVIKTWISKLKTIHPKVTESLLDKKYFKPTSEEIGSRILAHTDDTNKIIRENILPKVRSDIWDSMNTTYQQLNKNMNNNLSSASNLIYDTSYTNIVNQLKDITKQKIKDLLDDGIRLINYLYPISTSIVISNDTLTIMSDKKQIVIDLKGNKQVEIASYTNNEVLKPK